MDAKTCSLLTGVVILLVLILQRRVVFTWSTIGAFTLTNLIIVAAGVLAFPFVGPSFLQDQIGFADLSSITDRYVMLTIAISVGGMGIVLLGYHLTHLAFSGGRLLRRAPNLLAPGSPRSGFPPGRLLAMSTAALAFAVAAMLSNPEPFVSGWEALLAGTGADVLEARYAVMQGYGYVLVVYNILPFLGVALWLACRLKRRMPLTICAVLFNAVTLLILLLLFQKRPVLLYMLALLLAHLWAARSRRIVAQDSIGTTPRAILVAYGLVLFGGLMGLLLVQTHIGRGGGGPVEIAETLASAAAVNLLVGMSVPSLMCVRYFPAVEPFYGFSGIGLVARLFGGKLYLASFKVYSFYAWGPETGSISIPALTDFYCAFGLPGWAAGALALGFILNRVDTVVDRLPPNGARTLLAIFMLVFAYYLAHASLANSLLGYGGGIFVLLWLVLTRRFLLLGPSAEPRRGRA